MCLGVEEGGGGGDGWEVLAEGEGELGERRELLGTCEMGEGKEGLRCESHTGVLYQTAVYTGHFLP